MSQMEVSPGLEVGVAREASPGSVVFPLTLAPVFWTLPNARKYGSLLVNVDSPLTGTTIQRVHRGNVNKLPTLKLTSNNY